MSKLQSEINRREDRGRLAAVAPQATQPGMPELQAAALEAAFEAIILTDRDANILWVNSAFERLTGYSKEEAIGQSTRLLKSGLHPAAFYQQMWETILSGRKRAERELLTRDALFQAQAETMIDGILAVNESDKIILSNERFAQMWNIPAAMIHEGEDSKLLGFVTEQLDNPAAFVESVKHLYAHRDEKSADQLKLKDGRYFYGYSSPLVAASSGYCGRIWYFRDITESKQAEEKLRRSEEQFRQLAENIREIFFVLTTAPPRMLFISRAYDEVAGRSREKLYENPAAWIDAVHPDDRERVSRVFLQSLQGISTEMEYRLTRPDGSIRWLHARSFPVADRQGVPNRIVGLAADVTDRKLAEEAMHEAHKRLNAALRESEEQARASAKLTELVDILQSCQTVEEAYRITESVLQTILDSRAGALCITSASRNLVEAVVTWGADLASERTFQPDDCWALRRGRIHRVADAISPLRCAHIKGLPPDGSVCVPLAAQGETLGVLYLEYPAAPAGAAAGWRESALPIFDQRAAAVGERISLALANLQLREALRRQSIRDALTGLFNRRFMEESLEREMGRAARSNHPVALVMLDIDHFKRFNDTYGHQAGDTLLRALGDFLKQKTRGQDVACRYGGEEFAFILSGATVESAKKRAEILRAELKLLQVQHGGQLLGAITLSIGVAAFPVHGANTESLLKAADDALYRAKKEGRDRIVTAEAPG